MDKKSTWETIRQHMMTGIGYMIPIIVGWAVTNGIVQLIGNLTNLPITAAESLESSNVLLHFLAWINQVASPAAQSLMYPVLAAFIAYSIADRRGLMVGFFGGELAFIGGSGFIGAMIAAFIGGYFVKWLASIWKVKRSYRTIMDFMIYPLVSSVVIYLVMFFAVNPLGNFIMNGVASFIAAVGSAGAVAYAIIIAAMMAFDLGGPVNKAAFSIAMPLGATGVNMIPLNYGSMIAPLGFGMAVLFDKLIWKGKLFSESLEGAGLPSFIMGLFNVTEGAMPLMLDDPIAMIPINMLGSAIGAVGSVMVGNYEAFESPGNVLSFFIQPNPLSYMFWLFLGAAVIGILACIRRKALNAKAEKENSVSTEQVDTTSANV